MPSSSSAASSAPTITLFVAMAAFFPLARSSRLLPSDFQFASCRRTTGSFNNWKHLFGNSCKCCQSCWRHVHGSAHSPSEVQSSGTHSISQARSVQHWFKNWQHLRRNKLTASTFALAIGFWPRRRVQLWLEKIGAKEPFSDNLAIRWNNMMEQEALVRYKLITGNKVLFPEFQVHGERYSEDDWLAASPDGVVENIVYDLPSRGVLEIKCPYFRGDPWKRIPLYCMPQAQGLMEILDKDWMDFYVWNPKGSSLFRVYRDPEYWDVLKIALSDFWWNHVQPAKELYSESVITDPLVQLKSLKPKPRHELCSYIVYESKHAVDNSKLLVREIDGSLQ